MDRCASGDERAGQWHLSLLQEHAGPDAAFCTPCTVLHWGRGVPVAGFRDGAHGPVPQLGVRLDNGSPGGRGARGANTRVLRRGGRPQRKAARGPAVLCPCPASSRRRKYRSLRDLAFFDYGGVSAEHRSPHLDLSNLNWSDASDVAPDYSFVIGYPSGSMRIGLDMNDETRLSEFTARWIRQDLQAADLAPMDTKHRLIFVKHEQSTRLSIDPDGLSGSPVFSIVHDRRGGAPPEIRGHRDQRSRGSVRRLPKCLHTPHARRDRRRQPGPKLKPSPHRHLEQPAPPRRASSVIVAPASMRAISWLGGERGAGRHTVGLFDRFLGGGSGSRRGRRPAARAWRP